LDRRLEVFQRWSIEIFYLWEKVAAINALDL
jgi:hypothetical protein